MKAKVPKFTKAQCTACGKPAVITKGVDKLPGGVEHHYYHCQECGHKANVCYTDAEIRTAMEQQRAVHASGDEAAIKAGAERLQAMIDGVKESMEGSNG